MNPKFRNILIVLAFIAVCAALVGCGRKADPLTPEEPETAAQE